MRGSPRRLIHDGDSRCDRPEWQDASFADCHVAAVNYCTWGDIPGVVECFPSLAAELPLLYEDELRFPGLFQLLTDVNSRLGAPT